ncbi:MAG: hypothetical protein ACK5AY_10350, partial [Bacteroidota bacterium]
MRKILINIFFIGFIHFSFGLTWDEPWQEEIFNKSDYFVLGRVIDANSASVKIKVLRQFGDKKTEGEIELKGFHLLRVCSQSDSDKVAFYFQMIDSVYLFLKKTEIGYCLPTPTSGYAIVTNGKVLSTFRHSYHQAHLGVANYELCMKYIWAFYKKLDSDKKPMTEFIDKNLKKKPAGFNGNEINLFFLQHAALEVLYHSKSTADLQMILPFAYSNNNHLVISAVQCLGNYDSDESKKVLLKIISDPAKDNFVKSLAIECIRKIKPKEY